MTLINSETAGALVRRKRIRRADQLRREGDRLGVRTESPTRARIRKAAQKARSRGQR